MEVAVVAFASIALDFAHPSLADAFFTVWNFAALFFFIHDALGLCASLARSTHHLKDVRTCDHAFAVTIVARWSGAWFALASTRFKV